MECKMIESAAYRELQSLVIRLCGRIAHLASSTVSPKPDKWLTQEEVCKALRITKRALQYYCQTGVIPYTALGNKIFFKEEDIHRILINNLISVRR